MGRFLPFILGFGFLGLVACSHAPQQKPTDSSAAEGPALGQMGSVASTGGGTAAEVKTSSDRGDLDSLDGSEIPEDINESVLKWVSYFQGRGRRLMEKYLERSTRYTPVMLDILKKNGLPDDLVYISLIESGFSGTARSHAGAAGYWQFIRGTGKNYGLRINPYMDERRDPVRSTEAAAAYLKGLYNLFGSWYLAIASYNVGENRVKRQVMNNYTRDFWELARKKVLPRETIDYVPKFIAARMIAKDPAKYGFENLSFQSPYRFDELSVDSPVSLRKLAQNLKITYEEIKELNPSYKGEVATSGGAGPYLVRVPEGQKDVAANEVENCRVNVRHLVIRDDLSRGMGEHRIHSGETLSSISRKYGISMGALRSANDMNRKALLRAGGILHIPGRSVSSAPEVTPRASTAKKARASGTQRGDIPSVHIVRKGDTLTDISRRYGIKLGRLASVNGLRVNTRVQTGRRLIIPD